MINWKKIKSKKAFTLVETLTVIVVLSVIALITTPIVQTILSSSKEGLYDRQIESIVKAGKSWATKNATELPKTEGKSIYVSVQDLARSGFIDAEEILDPRNNKQMQGCLVISLQNKKYSYIYEDISCENVKGEYLIKYDDKLNLKEEVEVGNVYQYQNVTAVDTNGDKATVTGPTIQNVTSNKTVNSVDTSTVGTKYELTYVATDIQGNKKNLVIEVTVVDTTPPVITVQGKSKNFTYEYSTRDQKFVVPTATVEDNSGKVKQFNGKDYKVISNVGDLPGTYRMIYEAEDESGNKTKLTVKVVIENTDRPIIKEVTGNPTVWQNKDATLVVSKTSSKTKIVEYSFDNGTTWQTSKEKTFDHNQTVYIKIKDQDGNISNPYEVPITKIDKIAPTKPTIVLHKNNSGGEVFTSGTWVNTDVSQEQNANDNVGGSGIAKYERSIDKKKWVTMNINAIETVEQEQHYYVRAKDNAGNISEVSEVYVLRIDKTAPVCVSSGGSATWRNTDLTIYGTCSDPNGNYRSGCHASYQKISYTQSAEINTTTATPGDVYDIAGNKTTCPKNQTIKIDKTKPSCSITYSRAVDGTNGWFKGSSVGITLNRQDNGTIQSGVSNYDLTTSGSVSYNGSASNTQSDTGGKTWYGYVKDTAGNTNTCSNSLKVDTVSPTCTPVAKHGSSSGSNYGGEWYSGNIYTSATCGDSLSGCSSKKTVTTTGATTNVTDSEGGSWTVQANGTSYLVWKTYDNAGNVGQCSTITAKKDTVGPTITWTYTAGTSHKDYNGNTCYSSYTVDPTCSDSLSGYNSYTSGNGNPYSLPVGSSSTRTVTCKDNAGNTTTSTSSGKRVCKSSATSVCGAATCTASGCGCATSTCTQYKRSAASCGCKTWGSSTYTTIDPGVCNYYTCEGVPSPTSWEVASNKQTRTRHAYFCGNCTSYDRTHSVIIKEEKQSCSLGKRCSAAGCETSKCTKYKTCTSASVCGYKTCWHY